MQLGLKAGTDIVQIRDRLRYHPDVFEFFLTENDFSENGWYHLREMTKLVHKSVDHIIFHQPMTWHGWRTGLSVNERVHPDLYRFVIESSMRLIAYAQEVGALALIHGTYDSFNYNYIKDWNSLMVSRTVCLGRMCQISQMGGNNVVFENGIDQIFAYGDPSFENLLLKLKLPLAYDISHTFIMVNGNNDKLMASLNHLASLIKHYHIVDSMGGKVHDSLTVGHGKIDWERVVPRMNDTASSIFEINLQNHSHCKEMLESYRYLQQVEMRL
ncbi:TIM barrel protein [Lacticaseibacillus paracasei]|uniref:TIM barrel protein n=1 Tax=Lacticaseibacillus paracasei TaxID=1597 RepID=UPI00194EF58F|nr:TIM barrel protein [Lacticaseibacillus paracasei]MBM6411458.1 sugar phosphate isomerase/epimerase [Lacticaseibacillus paracasei]